MGGAAGWDYLNTFYAFSGNIFCSYPLEQEEVIIKKKSLIYRKLYFASEPEEWLYILAVVYL